MSKFADNTDMYIGTLTVDEVLYAGLTTSYLYRRDVIFLTLSPEFYQSNTGDKVYSVRSISSLYISSSGVVTDNDFGELTYFIPSTSLISNTQISGGDGTQSNPYIIK